MEFIAQTKLREVLRLDSIIKKDTVDGFMLNDLEGYKDYLKGLFTNFFNEIHQNFIECTDDNAINYYLRQLRYNKDEWEKIKTYSKQKTDFVMLDRPTVVNESNVLIIKEFLREKERYCTKAINKINTQIRNLESDGTEMINRVVKPKNTSQRSKKLTFGFQWSALHSKRAIFFKKIKQLKLIDGNSDTTCLKNVFYIDAIEKIAIETRIRWLAKTEKSNQYHKGALVYLINELERNGKISPINDIRLKNKKIKQFFADDNGNEIRNLNTVSLPTSGKNKTIIDDLISSLG